MVDTIQMAVFVRDFTIKINILKFIFLKEDTTEQYMFSDFKNFIFSERFLKSENVTIDGALAVVDCDNPSLVTLYRKNESFLHSFSYHWIIARIMWKFFRTKQGYTIGTKDCKED